MHELYVTRVTRHSCQRWTPCARRNSGYRLQALFDVGVRRGPADHADAHGSASLPDGLARPHRAFVLYGGDDAPRELGLAKGDEHLVEHDLVENLEPGRRETFREAPGLPAMCLDQFGEAGAPERTHGGPHVDAARATRELRREVRRVSMFGLRREILGTDGHRLAQREAVAHEGDAAVIGDVEPLVTVGRPGIGVLHSLDEMGARRGDLRPEPE